MAFYPTSTLNETQFDYSASVVSGIIETYLNRNLGLQTQSEYHWTDDSNSVVLDEYPINDIYLVSQGMGYYGNITLQNTNQPIQINNDKTNINIIYGLGATKNSFPLADYATVTLLMAAIKADIETETSGTATINLTPNYSSVSPIYLSNINYTVAGNNGMFEFYGFDLNNQISYTLEANRVLQFNRVLIDGSNAIVVIYNSGYADISALPIVLVDVANRMIRDFEMADVNVGSLLYQNEKLGNASVTNWDWDHLKDVVGYNEIPLKYKIVLDKFKKIDIAFY